MSKARRTPPLFEVLGGPGTRYSQPGVSATPGRREPVQVNVNGSAAEGARAGTPQPPAHSSAGRSRPRGALYVGIAAAIALLFGVWYVAFGMGRDTARRELAPHLDQPGAGETAAGVPSGGSPSPFGPSSASGAVPQTPAATPQGTPPPIVPQDEPLVAVGVDPRQPGVNYLHIVTLTWKDAEQAAAYLTKNGVNAGAAPAKRVDPQQARDKNLPHLVFALEGVPSDRFKESAARRADLVEKVRQIGKRWQREEHGASDFGEPGWVLFKADNK